MGILAVEFDLSRSGEPITKAEHSLSGPPKIPAVHITIYRTCSQYVRVMGREVYVCDSSRMTLKCMLYGPVVFQVQVPYQGLLVRGTGYPVVAHCKGGPL